MKRYIWTLALLAAGGGGVAPLQAQIQKLTPSIERLMRSTELEQVGSKLGVLSTLAPSYFDSWRVPYFDQDALYLDAIARAALGSPDAEQQLLRFVEEHPHSALLPYAEMRLGELYFGQGDWLSAIYWLGRYDSLSLPDTMAATSDYYYAYALTQLGRNDEAMQRWRPLRFMQKYANEATFYTGYLHYLAGAYGEAEHLLRGLLSDAKYGTHAAAYLADLLQATNRYSEAVAVAQSALDRADGAVRTSLHRTAGLSSSLLGRHEATISHLQAYVQHATPGRLELFTLGRALTDAGRHTEALPHLSAVVQDPKGTSDFLTQLAAYYQGLALLQSPGNQTEAAIRAWDRAAGLSHHTRLTEASAYNAALAAYSREVGSVGKGTERLVAFINNYATSELAAKAAEHLSDAYRNHTNVAEVLASLETIRELPPLLKKTREEVRLRKANTLLSKGDVQAASQQYDDIISKGVDAASVAEALLWKGEVAYRNGNYAEAIRATRDYLQRRPNDLPLNPTAYYNLGYAYFNRENYSEAAEAFRQYLAHSSNVTNDNATDVLNRLADIEVLGRRYDTALERYNEALARGGKDSDYALFRRGMTFGYLKQYRSKAEVLGTMLRRFPASAYLPEALYEQGRAHSLLSEERQAQDLFRRVFDEYPKAAIAPLAGVQLALSYFNQHRLQDASRVYTQVVRRYPHSDEAKASLEDLKNIAIELNQVDEYSALVGELGAGNTLHKDEAEQLAYLAVERVVGAASYKEAMSAIDKFVDRYPNGSFAAKALYNKALLQSKEKAHAASITTLEGLLSRLQGDPTLRRDALKLLASQLETTGAAGRAAEVYMQLALASKDANERSRYVDQALSAALKSNSYDFVTELANDVLQGQLQLTPASQARALGDALQIHARNNNKKDALLLAQRIIALPDNGMHTRAKVVRALDIYDRGNYAEARRVTEEVVGKSTNDTYWLARAFILLSDCHRQLGDKAAARSYLEGVRSNYTETHDGILDMIKDRLAKL